MMYDSYYDTAHETDAHEPPLKSQRHTNKANPLEAKLDAFGRFCVRKRACRNSTSNQPKLYDPKEVLP